MPAAFPCPRGAQDRREDAHPIDLDKAADIICDGANGATRFSAQTLIEAAWRCGALQVVGERPWATIGGSGSIAEIVAPDPDLVLRWRGGRINFPMLGERDVEAIYRRPANGLTGYNRLRVAVAEVHKLGDRFEQWRLTAPEERQHLAVEWWGHRSVTSHMTEPSPTDRCWFPLNMTLPIVDRVAAAHEIEGVDGVEMLHEFVKETDRGKGIDDTDRQFLIGLSGRFASDDELMRLDLLLRMMLARELGGSAESRSRVVQLLAPDHDDDAAETVARQILDETTLASGTPAMSPPPSAAAEEPGLAARSSKRKTTLDAVVDCLAILRKEGTEYRDMNRGALLKIISARLRPALGNDPSPRTLARALKIASGSEPLA